jgi:phage terminase large subunit-like protein
MSVTLTPELVNVYWAKQRIARQQNPWERDARPKQLPPPGDWRFWLLMAGRGFGKTRTGAEYVRTEVMAGRAAEVMLIAATTTDVRDIVVEGPSGIVKVCERAGWRVDYQPSKMRIVFPNGAVARTRGADEPDRIRGPECDLAWWDEFGTWKHRDAYTNADFGLRRLGPNGDRARAVVTFTPKPTPLVRELVKHPLSVLVGGHTDENADNLDPATLASYRGAYEGTRLGRQELGGELLTDTPGALWTLDSLDAHRIAPDDLPLLRKIAVGVDPAASSGEGSAETGIVVVGRDYQPLGHGYVLADHTLHGTPHQWATAIVAAYRRWQADIIVAEINNGGEMVEHTIRSVWRDAPIEVVHASRGKRTRAEPVSSLAEQGRWHHAGTFPQLEDQLTTWVPGDDSPDRLDAMVWAATQLAIEPKSSWADLDAASLAGWRAFAGGRR